MRVIVGFGNNLRGEDGFGVDLINELQKYTLPHTKLISAFQLTPELALELKEFDEIIFVDAAYSEFHHYAIACNIEQTQVNNLSHHITIQMILEILHTLYNHFPKYQVYSMLTNSFDIIVNSEKYLKNIEEIRKNLLNCENLSN